MGPQPVSLGGASPGAQSTTSTRSEEATPQPILVTEDVEASEDINQTMPELYMASLAGSFKEGKLRCIIDLAETFPDRPAGMYDAARGQCRSLSEDPSRRRTAGRRSKSGPRTFQSIQEDSELGDDIPVAHALFLPTNEQLPSAPFPILGKWGPSDEFTAMFVEGVESMYESLPRPEPSESGYRKKPMLEEWLRRRSVSRARYGKNTIRAIRLSETKAGFCRRSSPAPGTSQLLKQSRKTSPAKIKSEHIPGTTGPASDMVAKMVVENMEYRQKIKEPMQAKRTKSATLPPPPQKARPTTPQRWAPSPERAFKGRCCCPCRRILHCHQS